jgi:hypothetical protein
MSIIHAVKIMKRTLIVALLFLAPAIASAQLMSFKKVAGPPISKLGSSSGDYFLSTFKSNGDTLLVWMQHVTKGRRPNYNAARHADVVIWCYPNKWPVPNHVLPNIRGKIAVVRQNDVYWVIPEQSIWWERLVR